MFKIVIPQIEVDEIVRRRLLAPKIASGEPDGIYVLAFGTAAIRTGIGEIVDAVVAIDLTGSATGVAR